jgi:LysR family glycine cleavage system transcriptional activator
MAVRLPPLNALRAFEAAARHLSFTRAAAELHVTQGAVSRHVKLLEADLGVALFLRRHRGLELTERGRDLLPAVSDAFERIARAAARLASEDRDLRLIAPPSFAIRWLIPRLPRFRARQPAIRVRLTTDLSHDEFYRGGYDAGIDCDHPPRWPDLHLTPISAERLTPVCAPALIDGDPQLGSPGDLAAHTLLHPTPDHRDWRKWLAAFGVGGVDPEQGQTFNTEDMAVRAAAGGHGVAIGDLTLIAEELAAGQLVAPFDLVLSDDSGYYFICSPARAAEPKIAAFRDWLLAEAAIA